MYIPVNLCFIVDFEDILLTRFHSPFKFLALSGLPSHGWAAFTHSCTTEHDGALLSKAVV